MMVKCDKQEVDGQEQEVKKDQVMWSNSSKWLEGPSPSVSISPVYVCLCVCMRARARTCACVREQQAGTLWGVQMVGGELPSLIPGPGYNNISHLTHTHTHARTHAPMLSSSISFYRTLSPLGCVTHCVSVLLLMLLCSKLGWMNLLFYSTVYGWTLFRCDSIATVYQSCFLCPLTIGVPVSAEPLSWESVAALQVWVSQWSCLKADWIICSTAILKNLRACRASPLKGQHECLRRREQIQTLGSFVLMAASKRCVCRWDGGGCSWSPATDGDWKWLAGESLGRRRLEGETQLGWWGDGLLLWSVNTNLHFLSMQDCYNLTSWMKAMTSA